MAYAENTTVSVERSKAEIEQTVYRFGADGYVSGWQQNKAMIEFFARGRRVRFILELPIEAKDFAKAAGGRSRTAIQARSAMEQEQRRRWRSLALVVKAKLEAVESGIVEFEREFLAQIVLPGGQTVGDNITPMIADAYDRGRVNGSLLAIEGVK
jgi:hypothetical protein